MLTSTLTPKNTLLAVSLLSIALAVPVAVAGAEPSPDGGALPGTDVRQTPATVTVTAMVAPGQCAPVDGGPAAVEVTDTVAGPAPADSAVGGGGTPGSTDPNLVPVGSFQGQIGNTEGPGTSRFDPYTCAPVPASLTETAEDEATALQAPPAEVVPSYTPTLNPYPGADGIASGGSNESSDPLSAPTTSTTIPAEAPTTTTTVPLP